MDYRNLGNSGLKVSVLCLGAMTFGEADKNSFMHKVGTSKKDAGELIGRALDQGVNFIDTANVYGQDGLSERVVGAWLGRNRQRREDIVLATKFRFSMGSGPNDKGASRKHIISACEASLERLTTEYIDLYQIHMQDLDVPEQETLRALDDLVRSGKVRYIGASNYTAYRLVHSLWTSKSERLERFVSLQAQYSLIVRDIEREHVPVCREFGLGILPWSPLAAGFLSGKYKQGERAPKGSRLAQWKQRYAEFDQPRNWQVLEALRQVADELEASAAQVALAWLLHQPAVCSVVFGARTPSQLKDNLKAQSLRLSEEQLATLGSASDYELGYPYRFLKQVQGRW